METQVITLGGVHYGVVFNVVNDEPQIVNKLSTVVRADLLAWLHHEGYPTTGAYLMQAAEVDLPQGFYIKPHITDRYFRVYEDNVIDEVEGNQFSDTTNAADGF